MRQNRIRIRRFHRQPTINAIVKKLGGHDMAVPFFATNSWFPKRPVRGARKTASSTSRSPATARPARTDLFESKDFRMGDYAKQVLRSGLQADQRRDDRSRRSQGHDFSRTTFDHEEDPRRGRQEQAVQTERRTGLPHP